MTATPRPEWKWPQGSDTGRQNATDTSKEEVASLHGNSPIRSWSNPQTTSYHNKFMTFLKVEGRIFMRGSDGVYCYDLCASQGK